MSHNVLLDANCFVRLRDGLGALHECECWVISASDSEDVVGMCVGLGSRLGSSL